MLRYHFFFSIPEPEYAYKHYAYKKHVLHLRLLKKMVRFFSMFL